MKYLMNQWNGIIYILKFKSFTLADAYIHTEINAKILEVSIF